MPKQAAEIASAQEELQLTTLGRFRDVQLYQFDVRGNRTTTFVKFDDYAEMWRDFSRVMENNAALRLRIAGMSVTSNGGV